MEYSGMIRRLFNRVFGAEKGTLTPAVPENMRVYAVGDIHGRLDLLEALHQKMIADAAGAGSKKIMQVFVGDYVDRGEDSKGVIDWLINPPPVGWDRICLRGNHEKMMQDFLELPMPRMIWPDNGGLETMRSYNVDLKPYQKDGMIDVLRTDFDRRFPQNHRDFISDLTLHFELGDYFFVHAGVRPGCALMEQEEDDILWIRKEFLDSKVDFGKIIVHGHTIVSQPEIRHNRINIDTGAFMSDRLTCLVLDGEEQRFL